MTYRESLRDIEACLRRNRHLHCMGIRDNFTRTNFAKCRWRIELFFKRIKQNLSIKAFYGTSENAVNTLS